MAEGFKCRFCEKSFTKSQALGGHMNCHREEALEEQYQKAVAYIRSKQPRGYSTNQIWERNNVAQASCPNSNPQTPLRQNITIAYGNNPRASFPFTEIKDKLQDLAAIDYMENGETRRLPFPMAGPSNVRRAGKVSSHDVYSFDSNTQPCLGQTIPFPSKYGNTQGAPIPFTGLPPHQLGQAYGSSLNVTHSFDIQTIRNLSSDHPYGQIGMVTENNIQGYPVVSRNDEQEVEQQQQYVDMPSPPPLSVPEDFKGHSQNFQQQHIAHFGNPPPVNNFSNTFSATTTTTHCQSECFLV